MLSRNLPIGPHDVHIATRMHGYNAMKESRLIETSDETTFAPFPRSPFNVQFVGSAGWR